MAQLLCVPHLQVVAHALLSLMAVLEQLHFAKLPGVVGCSVLAATLARLQPSTG